MGDVLDFKTKDRCWRCGWNESVFLYFLEDKNRMVGLCCECGDLEYAKCCAGDDLRIIQKFFIPIGNGEHRRFSDATYADLQACEEYLRGATARQVKDAKISGGLMKEAQRLGVKLHEPVIPFLQEMAKLGWLSDEGQRCLDFALANWDMNRLVPQE